MLSVSAMHSRPMSIDYVGYALTAIARNARLANNVGVDLFGNEKVGECNARVRVWSRVDHS